jgi:regulatory protein
VPRITALQTQKRRAERVSVFVDGSFVVGLSTAVTRDLDLYVGRELAEDEVAEIAAAGDLDRAYRRALQYLRARLRSRAEMELRLRRYGYDGGVVRSVMEMLAARRYVDDREFAGAWVRDRVRLKPKGRRGLRAELVAKGVAAEDVEAALAENVADTEEELARRALAPRLAAIRTRGAEKARRAILSFLARRGFDAGLARRLADEFVSGPEHSS